MKIWAHRGCSQMYPENTLTSFGKAAALEGLTGIELDIQLTKDNYIVVCHDERVDRTTDGIGELQNFTLTELRKLRIDAGNGKWEQIPTIEEVFDLLENKFKNGLKLNIELKNSFLPYHGMEEKIINLVHQRNLQDSVVYSSFYTQSMVRVKGIDNEAEVGILDTKVSDCFYKAKGAFHFVSAISKTEWNIALHPYWRDIDLPKKQMEGFPVRAWFAGHLYPEKPTGTRLDLKALEEKGITDVFLNEPEKYL